MIQLLFLLQETSWEDEYRCCCQSNQVVPVDWTWGESVGLLHDDKIYRRLCNNPISASSMPLPSYSRCIVVALSLVNSNHTTQMCVCGFQIEINSHISVSFLTIYYKRSCHLRESRKNNMILTNRHLFPLPQTLV